MESCVWVFENYFDMTELLTDCGGQINTDGQVGGPFSLSGPGFV